MPGASLPTRTLTDRPDLEQLKRQAKQLLAAYRGGEADAATEIAAHYHGASPDAFALHDAQLVIARAYGFASWPRLKAFVEGANDRELVAAVASGDVARAAAMLSARPELALRSGALLAAVQARSVTLVRLLMRHGANAHVGVYPHRDATSPLTVAAERGYEEVVAAIREEERRRQSDRSGVAAPADELFAAIGSGDDERAIALMTATPSLVEARHAVFDVTPLLAAARRLDVPLVRWLIAHGAAVDARGLAHPADNAQSQRGDAGFTALDLAAYFSGFGADGGDTRGRFSDVAAALLQAGAAMTPRAAAALGRLEWLRARHADGALVNRIEESGGLLRVAVSHDRADVLAFMLDAGFDPDERTRFRDVGGDGVVFTWGMPLWQCAASDRHEMARMLLERGADPNAEVYASGSPIHRAYDRGDRQMIELLERHGGALDAGGVGYYGLADRAAALLASRDESAEATIQALLHGAACGGHEEIVGQALARIEWRRDDPRWFPILEQPLRVSWQDKPGDDRSRFVRCFALLVARCDPNLRGRLAEGQPFGLTLLHTVAGARPHVTGAERVAFATVLLDAGGRLDGRDLILESTPLAWACRWGQGELVDLFLSRGADPIESGAPAWATPLAWAIKMGHGEIDARLRRAGAR
jgi:ankyrin repeat protein